MITNNEQIIQAAAEALQFNSHGWRSDVAAEVVAAVTPLIREQIANEIATAVSDERSQHWNCGLNEAWAIAMKGLSA